MPQTHQISVLPGDDRQRQFRAILLGRTRRTRPSSPIVWHASDHSHRQAGSQSSECTASIEGVHRFFAVLARDTAGCPTLLGRNHALDPGEASAITLAWQNRESSLLIIDEKRGRRVSYALGLKITGTAGVLTDAAAAGLIPFEEIFQRLAQTQFRLSAAIVEQLRQRYQSLPPL